MYGCVMNLNALYGIGRRMWEIAFRSVKQGKRGVPGDYEKRGESTKGRIQQALVMRFTRNADILGKLRPVLDGLNFGFHPYEYSKVGVEPHSDGCKITAERSARRDRPVLL